MSSPRFKHVYLALMGGAFFCAFVLPPTVTDPARLHVAGIFNPLSGPVRRLAAAIYRSPDHSGASDPRDKQEIVNENDALRQEVARLQANVDRLQKLEAEREELGNLKAACVRVAVAGNDSGGRDVLLLSSPASGRLDQDAPVLYSGGLAGRLDSRFGGAGGSRLRLITDEGFSVTGTFIRFVDSGGAVTAQRINAPTPLVRGLGNGQLAVVGMKRSDYLLAGLQTGDWIVLDDSDWPRSVQGTRLGRIASCTESRQAPLFVDVRVQPEVDLTRLTDVWVVQRQVASVE